MQGDAAFPCRQGFGPYLLADFSLQAYALSWVQLGTWRGRTQPLAACLLAQKRLTRLAALLQVGGLRDTVHPYNPYENTGTGWSFEWADAGAFRDAIGNALYTYRCGCQA